MFLVTTRPLRNVRSQGSHACYCLGRRFMSTQRESHVSKFDDVMDKAVKQMKEQKIPVNRELLEAIGKSLGPSLYNRDASLVAAGQKAELETIKKKFLIKKLGCADDAKLDKALEKAVNKIGKSRRNKMRPVFYYLLVRDLKKEDVYI